MDDALYDIGNTARVSGWGWLTPNGFDPTDCLHAVDVNIISNQQATNMFNNPNMVVEDHEVATTGVGNIRQGACHGDSGGPLITMTEANDPVLIGVVSWGRPSCIGNNINSPSVFIRVSNIVNWIASNVAAISGPDQVCPGNTVTFTVTNVPSNYTWEHSSNLTPVANSPGTFTVSLFGRPITTWVSIRITVGNTVTEVARKTLQTGTPAGSISALYEQPCNCVVSPIRSDKSYRVYAQNIASYSNIIWEVIPPVGNSFMYSGYNPRIPNLES